MSSNGSDSTLIENTSSTPIGQSFEINVRNKCDYYESINQNLKVK